MDPETFGSISSGLYMLGGFFDFVVFVALMVVSLTSVRKVEPTLGYAVAGIAAARFLSICCSRVVSSAFDPMPFNDMNGAVPITLTLLGLVNPFLTLSLWAAVIYVVVKLAGRIAP
jgi:hypothetical protein